MIGIFDSGLGGLTVVKEVFRHLPEYQIIYFGDTARMPYGNRSPELIYQFTQEAVDFLFKQGAELIIVACATSSSEALRKIQQEYLPKHWPEKKVLGVIRPLVEMAVQQTKNKKIGLVGTKGTVNSQTFIKEIKKINPQIEVYQQFCPLLVPLIEEGWLKQRETKMILRKYLWPLKQKKIDTLILGCTHYPILLNEFKRKAGKNCQVLNTGEIVAKSLVDYLQRHPEIEKKLKKVTEPPHPRSARAPLPSASSGQALEKEGRHQFFVSDITGRFKEIAQNWLGRRIELKIVKK